MSETWTCGTCGRTFGVQERFLDHCAEDHRGERVWMDAYIIVEAEDGNQAHG